MQQIVQMGQLGLVVFNYIRVIFKTKKITLDQLKEVSN
jgi:hypothetical protein